MPGTDFQTLQNIVYANVASDTSDSVAALIIPAALNYASTVVALLFKPPELNLESDQTYLSLTASLDLSSLNFSHMVKVFNATLAKDMFSVPFETLTLLTSAAAAGRFYSVFGNKLYMMPVPLGNVSLQIYYQAFPTAMVNSNDPVGYVNYDSYIIAIASAIYFASKEEGESADIWNAVAGVLGAPFLQSAQMKEMIAGRQTLLESQIAQAVRPRSAGQGALTQ